MADEVLSAVDVVNACYAAWAANDLDDVMARVDDACDYRIHVPRQVLRFAGQHHGKVAIRRCLEMIKSELDFLAFCVDWIRGSGDTVRARIVYYYKHEGTGEQLEGNLRQVWRVSEGRVWSLDEFHDVARLRAFLDMVRAQLS